MALEQEDIDMALVPLFVSVVNTIVDTGRKPSEAITSMRQTLDDLEKELKKDEAYE